MKTAAIFFADGFEEVEAITPLDYLRRAGVKVTTVLIPSPQTQHPDVAVSSHKLPIITDTTMDEYLAEADNNLPDCVICPGGSLGAQNLAASDELRKHLEKCYANGKLVAAICASPAVVLGKTNILKDKKWTCYPDMQGEANKDYLSGYSDKPSRTVNWLQAVVQVPLKNSLWNLFAFSLMKKLQKRSMTEPYSDKSLPEIIFR